MLAAEAMGETSWSIAPDADGTGLTNYPDASRLPKAWPASIYVAARRLATRRLL
jgi:hypothetical protein